MKVIWQIESRHEGKIICQMGKNGPQQTIIDDKELAICETEYDRDIVIEEHIQEDFENHISWFIISKEGE